MNGFREVDQSLKINLTNLFLIDFYENSYILRIKLICSFKVVIILCIILYELNFGIETGVFYKTPFNYSL